MTIEEERDDLKDQLYHIDEVLARRPALAHLKSRYGKVSHVCDMMSEADRLLRAASHGLRSYQYGNAATELAKEMADSIDTFLDKTHTSKPEPLGSGPIPPGQSSETKG